MGETLNTTKLELLAPARNLAFGRAALNFGADAVYVGAPRFGARAAAGATLQEIESLCQYAHRFDAKVLVAFNTLIYERELEDARKLIHQLWDAGADALIVQDMGITEMGLPPIALHASTQAHNADVEKVAFLEKVGFRRVVLARELSTEQMAHIRAHTSLELETFVHGALCVSYSGQCRMSAYIGNRSGNRGECAQSCRLKFDLLDKDRNPILKDKNILSVKDMNRSGQLQQMAEAGITSFKIEGRLKDISYVKNITAWYRMMLDGVMENKPQYKPASRGVFHFSFEPRPDKTFNRGYTEYLSEMRETDLASASPKSTGELLGQVEKLTAAYFSLAGSPEIQHGDGLCFVDDNGDLAGFSVNRTDGNKIYYPPQLHIKAGTPIYRNHDHDFEKKLAAAEQCRFVEVDMVFGETETGYHLTVTTPDGEYQTQAQVETPKQTAREAEKAQTTIRQQLGKTGDTLFKVRNIDIACSGDYFIPISQLNTLRREALTSLFDRLGSLYSREEHPPVRNNFPYPAGLIDYKGNVSNSLAVKFYKRHGAEVQEQTFELHPEKTGKELMTTKYCLKYELGICPHHQHPPAGTRQPAYLVYQEHTFSLDFDCKACRMHIRS